MPAKRWITIDDLRELLRELAQYTEIAVAMGQHHGFAGSSIGNGQKCINRTRELEAKLAGVDKVIFLAKREEEKADASI